jgi:hypothetical protein
MSYGTSHKLFFYPKGPDHAKTFDKSRVAFVLAGPDTLDGGILDVKHLV